MKHLPQINLFYWVLIISANTMGETAGDFISQTLGLGYGPGTLVLLTLYVLGVVCCMWLAASAAWLYWAVLTLASTVGTTISDFISRSFFHLQLGYTENQGYWFGTCLLGFVMGLVFLCVKYESKKRNNKSYLSRIGIFLYWLAMLTSSTLGTALGDLLAHNTPLGFDGSTLLLLVFLLAIIILFFTTSINRTLLYWATIVVTHPIGATMGDYLTKPEGFNMGNTFASCLLVVVFILLISLGKVSKQHGIA